MVGSKSLRPTLSKLIENNVDNNDQMNQNDQIEKNIEVNEKNKIIQMKEMMKIIQNETNVLFTFDIEKLIDLNNINKNNNNKNFNEIIFYVE